MNLELKDIKDITFGAADIEQSDDGICFYRFSKKELKFYSETPYFQKAFASAGIVMEFITDAESLKLTIDVSEGSSRTYFACDFFVDDKFVGDIRNYTDSDKNELYVGKDFKLGQYSGEFKLGCGQKTIKIVFPWSVSTIVKEMILDGATFITGVKKEKNMLMYGDSITHGYDALSPSNTYAARLADKLNVQAFNKAIGGEIYRAGLADAGDEISPDYITVAYGTNDWCTRKKEEFVNDCEGFLSGLARKYPAAKIFVISPIWRKDKNVKKDFGTFYEVEHIIHDICGSHNNLIFVSGERLVPEDVALYADLRLHPNDEGFSYYFDNLFKVIESKL